MVVVLGTATLGYLFFGRISVSVRFIVIIMGIIIVVFTRLGLAFEEGTENWF